MVLHVRLTKIVDLGRVNEEHVETVPRNVDLGRVEIPRPCTMQTIVVML